MSKYGIQCFKTFTVVRGKEFSCYKRIESEYEISVYFADAYSSWQRGTNENSNGLLREFFPKSMDLSKVLEEELLNALRLINERPRKVLNYIKSNELFNKEVSHLI